ncbi:hypothetical protein [Pleurocapsa sp. PCC 7319]|uniref:hypothetical protein n=1 Tax=Pleurocapsa sp. PCC 7319 TaxID=118161 RepID=UPI00035DBAA2|nr:hypothetical protein [Pleurocapsa sp. PCC 7319]
MLKPTVIIFGAISLGIVVMYAMLTSILTPNLASFDIDSNIPDEALELTNLPKSRPFLMGFTNQPFDRR